MQQHGRHLRVRVEEGDRDDPRSCKRFRHFVNSDEPDRNVIFVQSAARSARRAEEADPT